MISKITKDIITLINSFYFYISDTFNNLKKVYDLYQSSNSLVAPFEFAEAVSTIPTLASRMLVSYCFFLRFYGLILQHQYF